MTDFFQRQDDARKRTRLLVVLFIGAVGVVIGLNYLLHGLLTYWGEGTWAPSLALAAGAAGAVIGMGSGFKMMQLSGGGAVVAKDLGGREVDWNTRDPDEKRLLNIVQEMSIASGVPVPQVWVMDGEDGINAFAAGKSTSDAVIGVTRGCLRAMNRDELQGVIAHEFSHILNGDMRLNMRMIGVVHGILVIAIIGGILFRSAARMRGGGKNNPAPALLLIGAALYGIGYFGVLLGRLIKSAVSRQREFLADASAVQFTRNPDGIGRALMKIGGSAHGAKLKAERAEEASHMMFGNLKNNFSSLFATHPPLEQRIRAVLPSWDGAFLEPGRGGEPEPARPRDEEAKKPGIAPWQVAAAVLSATPQVVVDRVGELSHTDLENAARLRESLPPEIEALLQEPRGAQAVIFGLLISGDESAEVSSLANHVDGPLLRASREVAALVESWHSSHAISLIDLSIPALRHLSPSEYEQFVKVLDSLVASDELTDLFEFMLQNVLRRHLDRWFHRTPPAPIRYRAFPQLLPELETILTALCGIGARTPDAARAALEAGQKLLSEHGIYLTLQARPAALSEVSAALTKFDSATPLVKKQLLMACAVVAAADHEITSSEAELLRAIADAIGCPLPPLRMTSAL
jgi:Zn-dependent protease with chaperone function